MMTAYISQDGDYYEGDRIDWRDTETDVRDRVNVTPTTITGRQGQLALIELGLYTPAREIIDSMTGDDRLRADVNWGASTWNIDDPFLQQLWAALGRTPEQLGEAFALASTL